MWGILPGQVIHKKQCFLTKQGDSGGEKGLQDLFFFNWSVVNIQYDVSFRCTVFIYILGSDTIINLLSVTIQSCYILLAIFPELYFSFPCLIYIITESLHLLYSLRFSPFLPSDKHQIVLYIYESVPSLFCLFTCSVF